MKYLKYIREPKESSHLLANITRDRLYPYKTIKIAHFYNRVIVNDIGKEIIISNTALKENFQIVQDNKSLKP